MNSAKHLKLVPLARVSRLKGRDPALAERDYRETLERWGQEQDNVTMLEFLCDHDKSGGKLAGRAGLDHAMELIRSGDADGVVVPEAKRFGRNLRESLNLIDEITTLGALFVPLDVPGAEDPTDRNYKLALHLWLSIAEHELDGYREQWAKRKLRWAEAGAHIGKAPRGYRHIAHGKGEDPIGLEPDDEAELVREVFRVCVTDGLPAAAKLLGTPPSKAKLLLANEVYKGQTSWDGIVRQDTHVALVDGPTFRRVQKVLTDQAPPSRSPRGNYPLTGVAHCARCGATVVGALAYRQRSYRCGTSGGSKAKKCGPFANLYAGELEDYLRALLVLEAQHREMIPEDHPEVVPELQPAGDDVPEAERALEVVRLRRDEFAAAELDISLELFAARAKALDDAVTAAESVYDAALAASTPQAIIPTSEQIEDAPLAELPKLLEQLQVRATVKPERLPIQERVSLQSTDVKGTVNS